MMGLISAWAVATLMLNLIYQMEPNSKFPKDMEAANKVRGGLSWVLKHYGAEYVPKPIRLVEGSGEHAIKELYDMFQMLYFGKVVLKHPLR
jgi:hypothetical protein